MPELEWTYAEAIRGALAESMRADPSVLLLGEDVAHGGVFGVTRGLAEEFGPRRVRNTPISEAAITGLAVGAALVGLRPVVEIMFMDFITLGLDMLVNQAAKLPFLSGGQQRVPLVLRTQAGALNGAGAQHSQSLEAWLAHVPGLTVLAPATPADAFAALRWALTQDGPCVLVEQKALYGERGPRDDGTGLPRAPACRVRRPGRDVTLATYGAAVRTCLEAAAILAAGGVEAEVVDLFSLAPLDLDGLLASLRRTHRLIVVHEAPLTGGLGGEIVACLADRGFDELDAPPRRVGALDLPLPVSPPLEAACLPSAERVAAAVRGLGL